VRQVRNASNSGRNVADGDDADHDSDNADSIRTRSMTDSTDSIRTVAEVTVTISAWKTTSQPTIWVH
jgi:hypothetical protein